LTLLARAKLLVGSGLLGNDLNQQSEGKTPHYNVP
jgi:hypothetical protein